MTANGESTEEPRHHLDEQDHICDEILDAALAYAGASPADAYDHLQRIERLFDKVQNPAGAKRIVVALVLMTRDGELTRQQLRQQIKDAAAKPTFQLNYQSPTFNAEKMEARDQSVLGTMSGVENNNA